MLVGYALGQRLELVDEFEPLLLQAGDVVGFGAMFRICRAHGFDVPNFPVFDRRKQLRVPLPLAHVIELVDFTALVGLTAHEALQHPGQRMLAHVLRQQLLRKSLWDRGRMLLVKMV